MFLQPVGREVPPALDAWLGHYSKSKYAPETLGPRHKQVVMLYLRGFTPQQISDETGFSPAYIARLIKSPAAQLAIDDYLSWMDGEYSVLYIKAIETLREAMDPLQDIKLRVDVAKTIVKAKIESSAPKEGASAEDVISRIFAQFSQINIENQQVNINQAGAAPALPAPEEEEYEDAED